MTVCISIENNNCLNQVFTIDNKKNCAVRITLLVISILVGILLHKYGVYSGHVFTIPVVSFVVLFVIPSIVMILRGERDKPITQSDVFDLHGAKEEAWLKKVIFNENIDLNAYDHRGYTILQSSVLLGDLKLIELLLQNSKLNVNQKCGELGETALGMALDWSRRSTKAEFKNISFLLFRHRSIKIESLNDRQLFQLYILAKNKGDVAAQNKITSQLLKRDFKELEKSVGAHFSGCEQILVDLFGKSNSI